MSVEIKENNHLGEKLIINQLRNGIKCYIIPKKDFIGKQAMVCVNFGSLDKSFQINSKKYEMPSGVAHFLEHKLFADDKINVFDEFSKLGGEVNAYTNFTTTAYYFTASENFEGCLRTLLSFVGRPYFTDANVEKEKEIIVREINMYDDDPQWQVYFNMLKGMFGGGPAGENIAGTPDSVRSTTKQMLYDCYNAFYTTDNIAVICVGDVNCESVYNLIERYTNGYPSNGKAERNIKCGGINGKSFITKKMNVSRPLFNIGFKETDFKADIAAKKAQSLVMLELLAGDSSELYGKLFSEGLIDDSFGIQYTGNLYFGTSVFGGLSDKAQLVYEALSGKIKDYQQNGIGDVDFERVKKKIIGRTVRRFDVINGLTSWQADCFANNTNLLSVFDALCTLQKNDIINRLNGHFNMDLATFSIIEKSE